MTRIRLEMLAALCALLCVPGCAGGLLGGGEKPTLYRLGAAPDASVRTTPGSIPIVIARPDLPTGADGDRILTLGGQEAAYLAEARWISPAPQLMREMITDAVERNVRSAYVPNIPTGSEHLLVSTRFTAFAAYYEAGPNTPPVVRIVAQTELRRSGATAPLAVQIHSSEQPAAENRVSAVVAAFDAASLQLADEIALWINDRINEQPL